MKPRFNTARFSNKTLGASLATAIVVCLSGSAMAQTSNFWNGAVSTAWNTDGNWSLGVVPTKAANEHAVINTNTGNIATITVGAIPPADIIVGTGAGNSGLLNHLSGDASTGASNSMYVGTDGGTGVFNLADTTGAGGTHTGFGTGSGSMTVSGDLWVGGSGVAGSNGTLNVNTTGLLTVGSAMNISGAGGTGILNIDNGAVSDGFAIRIGYQAGGNGTLNMSGGSLTKTGSDVFVIAGNGSVGVANVSGGSININSGEAWVGNGATVGTNGTFNLTGGTFTANNWFSIGRAGGTGVLNLDGGTVVKQGSNSVIVGGRDGGASTGTVNHDSGDFNLNNGQLWIGQNAGTTAPRSTGTYNLNGGSITVNSWLAIGREGGIGTLNITDGTFTKQGANHTEIGGTQGAIGLVTQSGGTFTASVGEVRLGLASAASGGSGTWTMTGGLAELGVVKLAYLNNGTGTINLNGGTMVVTRIEKTLAPGLATVNFNGGTLRAKANEAAFLQGLNAVNVSGTGATIDTDGFNITIGQALTGGGVLLKKVTDGTLTLTGANTFSGNIEIEEGKLGLTTDSTNLGTTTLTVVDEATFGVTQTAVDAVYSVNNGVFGGDTVLDLDFGAIAGLTLNAPLNVATSLTLDGDTTINIADANAQTGILKLVSYAGGSHGGTFVLGTLPDGVVTDPIVDDGSLVSVNITRANDPYWLGTTNAIWNTTDGNWNNEFGAAATTFADGDPAMFDDRVLAGPTSIDIPADVTVGGSGMTVNNTTVPNYTFSTSGTGGINGSTGLLKAGTGTLTLGALSNGYTGVTTLSGGTTVVGLLANGGLESAIGAASADPENLLLNGGILLYNGASTTINRGFLSTAVGGGINTPTGTTLTLSGIADSINGQFIKFGTGGVTFTTNGDNFFGGGATVGINVREGTLTFDGTGGTQTNNATGGIWVGMDQSNADSHMVLTDTLLQSPSNYLAIARGNGTTGLTATCTLTDSTLITGNLSLGFSNGLVGYLATSQLTLNDSTYTMTGISRIGESSGATSTVTLNGASDMTCNLTNVAQDSGSNGTLNVKGTSVYTSNARLAVGTNGGSTGNVIIEETGSIVVNSFASVGFNGGGSMTVKNSGSFSTNDDFSINESGDVPATVTLQDSGSISAGGTVFIGRNDNRVGTLTQTGGTFTSTGPVVNIALANGTTGLVDLSGGTFEARRIAGGNGTANFNLNGGLIKAGTGSDLNYMSNLDAATVLAGGANFDTNGETIAINQALLDGGGGGGLTKTGAGFLQLNGTNTYTGTTTVSAGVLGGTGSIAGPLDVTGTGTLAPGASVGTFTAGNTTISGTYACEIDGNSADVLAAGTLDVSAATLAITELNPAVGTLVIATYTGAVPAAFNAVTGLPAGYTISYTGGQIALVSSSAYDAWVTLNGVTEGPTGDDENDGIENLLEFVLNGDPKASDTNILPTQTVTATDFIFTFNRADESTTEVGLTFQYGSDLTGWTDVAIPASGPGTAPVSVNEAGDPDVITVTIPKGVNTKLFGRLKAVK